MNLPNHASFKTLQFYATAPYPCSYLPHQEARSQVAAPTHLVDADTYSRLVEKGFRRSGLFTYRPFCDQCSACVPIRVDVERFQPSRTQRKTWKRHAHLQSHMMPLRWEPEHYELYHRYQASRHPGAGMDEDSQSQYRQFLLTSRVESQMVEFREPDGRLQMVSMIDVLDTGLSAVYTFFDPHAPGSLGSYGVLWQIAQCRQIGLPWLYLGYWIEQSRKMSYKTQYRPHQILKSGAWIEPPTS
jgi:arginine-tRNA-protein transferase